MFGPRVDEWYGFEVLALEFEGSKQLFNYTCNQKPPVSQDQASTPTILSYIPINIFCF